MRGSFFFFLRGPSTFLVFAAMDVRERHNGTEKERKRERQAQKEEEKEKKEKEERGVRGRKESGSC